jgi:hypothetical protein
MASGLSSVQRSSTGGERQELAFAAPMPKKSAVLFFGY